MYILKKLLKLLKNKHFEVITSFFFFLSLKIIVGTILLVFFYVPDDYLQGDLVRIMYVHVPLAWLSMSMYSGLGVVSLLYIIKKSPIFDIIGKSTAPILLLVTFLALATGSIWGKPAWGTWWVWDARLTSMLILFFITLSYIMIRDIFIQKELGAIVCSITAVVGAINLPIIKFSVDIWNTLHQKSSFLKLKGPSIHPSMLYPNILMFLGILTISLVVIILKVRRELLESKIKRIQKLKNL